MRTFDLPHECHRSFGDRRPLLYPRTGQRTVSRVITQNHPPLPPVVGSVGGGRARSVTGVGSEVEKDPKTSVEHPGGWTREVGSPVLPFPYPKTSEFHTKVDRQEIVLLRVPTYQPDHKIHLLLQRSLLLGSRDHRLQSPGEEIVLRKDQTPDTRHWYLL